MQASVSTTVDKEILTSDVSWSFGGRGSVLDLRYKFSLLFFFICFGGNTASWRLFSF